MSGICALWRRDHPERIAETLGAMSAGLSLHADERVERAASPGIGLAVSSGFGTQQVYQGSEVLVACDADLLNEKELRDSIEGPQEIGKAALIAALYTRFGTGFVEKLRGSFSFILWDRRERTLLASVDAVGVKRLAYHDDGKVTRTKNYKQLREFWSQYEEYFILPKQLPDSRTGWLAFAVTIREKAPFIRRDMQIFLEKRNIQTRTVFTGNILRQPGFKNLQHKSAKAGYPEADKVMRGGMLLACHHGLSQEQISHIMESVSEFMKNI